MSEPPIVYDTPYAGAGHDAARHVPIYLHRARDAMAARLRLVFEPHDLTDAQWRVLRLLSVAETVDTAELARRAFLLGPSVSRIVRDLSERGLMQRRSCEDDARRSLHSITPAGMALVQAILPEFDPLYERIEREMGMEDLNQLNTLMARLARILATVPDTAAECDQRESAAL